MTADKKAGRIFELPDEADLTDIPDVAELNEKLVETMAGTAINDSLRKSYVVKPRESQILDDDDSPDVVSRKSKKKQTKVQNKELYEELLPFATASLFTQKWDNPGNELGVQATNEVSFKVVKRQDLEQEEARMCSDCHVSMMKCRDAKNLNPIYSAEDGGEHLCRQCYLLRAREL